MHGYGFSLLYHRWSCIRTNILDNIQAIIYTLFFNWNTTSVDNALVSRFSPVSRWLVCEHKMILSLTKFDYISIMVWPWQNLQNGFKNWNTREQLRLFLLLHFVIWCIYFCVVGGGEGLGGLQDLHTHIFKSHCLLVIMLNCNLHQA